MATSGPLWRPLCILFPIIFVSSNIFFCIFYRSEPVSHSKTRILICLFSSSFYFFSLLFSSEPLIEPVIRLIDSSSYFRLFSRSSSSLSLINSSSLFWIIARSLSYSSSLFCILNLFYSSSLCSCFSYSSIYVSTVFSCCIWYCFADS